MARIYLTVYWWHTLRNINSKNPAMRDLIRISPMKSVGKKCRVTSTPKGLNNQIKLWVSINKEHGIEFDERYLFWCSTPLGLVFYVVVVLLPTDFIGGYLCLTLRVFFPIIDYQCIKTCTERSRGKWILLGMSAMPSSLEHCRMTTQNHW